MEQYRRIQEFVELLLKVKALGFGDFTLKSGRKSPYFFNSGTFNSGQTVNLLGYYYAARILDTLLQPTIIFGPAYKGIPLVVATATQFAEISRQDVGWCFDRKEEKGHGDKGVFVGRTPTSDDRVLVVDDVITTGATKFESIELIKRTTGASVIGTVVALNRQEKTPDGKDPVAELEALSSAPVISIVTIDEVVEALRGEVSSEILGAIEAYRKEYGVETIGAGA